MNDRKKTMQVVSLILLILVSSILVASLPEEYQMKHPGTFDLGEMRWGEYGIMAKVLGIAIIAFSSGVFLYIRRKKTR